MADINLLVISVGNSRTAVAAFVGGELRDVRRIENGDHAARKAALKMLWETHLKGTAYPAACGVSVNPAMVTPVELDVEEATAGEKETELGLEVMWVGPEIELPIEVLTERPKETGGDRVLNIAAAFEQLGKSCVVVDAGTAVTVDLCDDQGNFLGGAIAPGVRMQLAALKAQTASLPAVELTAAPGGLYGRNTEDALRQGVFFGIRGLVKELVEQYATQLGSWPELIATGGDADLLFRGWELTHAVSPDLTLYGVALAYTEHQIKHQLS